MGGERTKGRITPYYFVVAGVFLQGLSPVLTKLLLEDLSQATVVAARYCLAAALLMPFGVEGMRRSYIAGRPRKRDWLALALVGGLGSGVGALLFTAAVYMSAAGLVNSISKTAPIFVAFLAYLTLHEKVSNTRLLLVSGMVGANLLIGAGEIAAGGVHMQQRLIGDGLALAAGMTRAASEILAKSALRRFTPVTVTFWRFGMGFVVAGGVALFSGGYRSLYALDLRGWGLLVVLAAVCTALSMFLYYRGMSEIPSHVAVSLKLLGAIVTVVVSWIVLSEALNLYHVAGIGVLISSAYLLVLRTAREAPKPAARESRVAATAQRRPWRGRRLPALIALTSSFRWKIVVLVSIVIITTVAGGTYISVRHTQEIVREQVRLMMVQVGTMVLNMATLEERPSPYVYQQYLERLVQSRIMSKVPLYSIEIVYIGVMDDSGSLVAFAYNPQIQLVDKQGHLFPVRSAQAGRQLYELNRNVGLAGSYGIIPVEVEGRSEGRVRAKVWMGCRRSIAERPAAEIAARNAGLALLLLVIGIAVTTLVVSRLTRPLERLSTSVYQLARGDTNSMRLLGGDDEIGQMARHLVAVQEGLALNRRWRSGLLRTLAGVEPPTANVKAAAMPYLAVELSGRLSTQERERLVETVLEIVFAHEGEVIGEDGGVIVSAWGLEKAESDDVLRALMAGKQIRDVLAVQARDQAGGRVTLALWEGRRTDVRTMTCEHKQAHATFREVTGRTAVLLMSAALQEVAEFKLAGSSDGKEEDSRCGWYEVGETTEEDNLELLSGPPNE